VRAAQSAVPVRSAGQEEEHVSHGVAFGTSLLAPRGLGGSWIPRHPIALFGVQRRLVVSPPAEGPP
jgi:hypothetical protein